MAALKSFQRLYRLGPSNIRQLLEQRWLAVALSLMLTGLGAALTSILFKTGVSWLSNWRLNFRIIMEITSWASDVEVGRFHNALMLFNTWFTSYID